MTQKHSVVTPERFASGFTYSDYLGQIKVSRDEFEKYCKTSRLTPEDVAFFRRIAKGKNSDAKMLVLGEDWCPDVFRGMPVMARIAEAAGMEMRIFPRDANIDIMNEFLNRGEFMSIPVAVFYTNDLQYICHWIERPALANEERAKIEEDVKKEMPKASEQETRTQVRERTQSRYPAWQKETVKEMRELLAEKLGI